jgi:hypothetical protein
MSLQPLDYGRSFILGRWPENEVRFWVESRTRIIDAQQGLSEDYVQCASCKSEDTFAERNLFYEDNYDFLPVFGPEYSLIYRRKAWLNPNYRSCPLSRDLWAGQIYHLLEGAGVEELHSTEAVIQATHAMRPIVAQTEYSDAASGLRAIIEYPVKTLNTNRQRQAYQVDTGPVLFADLSRRPERLVDSIALAFVAFNVPHFADVVVEVPTAVGAGAPALDATTRIHHYSQRVTLTTVNRLYALA